MLAIWDAFRGAMLILVGAGPVKQRLLDAYRVHLASVRDQDLPDALRARFAALRHAMHGAHATGSLSALEVSVRKMSEKDAADHASAILEMFAVLCAEVEATSGPRLRIVGDDGGGEDVPAFLSRA